MKAETSNKSGGRKSKSGWRKLIILGVVLAAIVFVLRYTDAAQYLTLTNLRRFREAAGAWATLSFVVLYAAGTVIAFPGSLLSLSGGLLFGTFLGGTLIIVGATIGATAAFLLARYAGRDAVEKFVSGGQLERFDQLVSGSGLSAVLFTRLVPLFPFNLINFAWGLTSVSLRDYVIGTAIGIIPGAFVFANLAGAVARALEGTDGALASVDLSRLLNRDVFAALALLGLLALTPTLVKLWRSRLPKTSATAEAERPD